MDSAVFQTAGIAQKFNCTLNRLDYLQEQGLMSSLPLANNLVPIKRALTTTSTAIFVPFTTQELFMEGDSLYYGLNAVSNNMIMADRKQLKNPNGLILGTPGSGKSFSAKREMASRRMRLRHRMQSRPQRKADFPLRMKKAVLSVAWEWALRRWRRKEWTPPPNLPIRKYIRWKKTIPAWKLPISRKKPPNACTTLSKAEKSPKTNLPEQRKEVARIRSPAA